MAKVDAGAARLAPVFEDSDDGDGGGGGGGAGGNEINSSKEALVAAGLFENQNLNNSDRGNTRSLSPEAVSKEERTAAYRYGQEIVPLSADLRKQACKLPTPTIAKSMLLLGFSSPPPLHAIESGAWVMTAGGAPAAKRATKANPMGGTSGGGVTAADSHAAEALSALARACHKTGKVMVVRWVKTAEGDPRLYAGFPVLGEEIDDEEGGSKGKGKGNGKGGGDENKTDLDLDDGRGRGHRPRLTSPDCFVLVALPFADDVRRVKFPPLDADIDRMPTNPQVKAAKEYVRAWDLSGTGLFARAAVDGSEGREGEGQGEAEGKSFSAAAAVVAGGAHPHLSRLRQLACAAAKTAAVIKNGRYKVPEVGTGPAMGLLEPPAWPEGSRADVAARGMAEAFATVP